VIAASTLSANKSATVGEGVDLATRRAHNERVVLKTHLGPTGCTTARRGPGLRSGASSYHPSDAPCIQRDVQPPGFVRLRRQPLCGFAATPPASPRSARLTVLRSALFPFGAAVPAAPPDGVLSPPMACQMGLLGCDRSADRAIARLRRDSDSGGLVRCSRGLRDGSPAGAPAPWSASEEPNAIQSRNEKES